MATQAAVSRRLTAPLFREAVARLIASSDLVQFLVLLVSLHLLVDALWNSLLGLLPVRVFLVCHVGLLVFDVETSLNSLRRHRLRCLTSQPGSRNLRDLVQSFELKFLRIL